MKKFEDFSRDDLWALRKQVTVNSIYVSDYQNNLGISAKSASIFFDGWLDFCQELMEEDGKDKPGDNFFDYFDEYDNADTLEQWFLCCCDFDWVKYDQDMVKEEINKYLSENLSEVERVALFNEWAERNKYSILRPMSEFEGWVNERYTAYEALRHIKDVDMDFDDDYWRITSNESIESVSLRYDVEFKDFFENYASDNFSGVCRSLNRNRHSELFELFDMLD